MVKNIIKYRGIIIIIFIWFIFSSQYFLRGLAPFPADYLLNFFDPWHSYDILTGPVKNNAMPDVITQIYPWKTIVIDSFKNGNFPLWNPYSFSGTPLLANYQSAVLTPLNLLYFIFPFNDAWSVSVLAQPLLASLFMFLYLRVIKRSEYASVIGAIAFGFCGFVIAWMTYQTLGYAILFLPLALYAIEKFYLTQKWQYSLILSLSIPLSFFSGHFQTSLYFLIFVFLYILFKFIVTRKTRILLLNLLSVVFGLLISMPQLIPSIEFYLNSPRSNNYQILEIIPWLYVFTFFSPDFFGNPVTRNDWFGHYAEWNAYIGVLPFFIGFYAIRNRNPYTYFFFLMSVLAIFFAFKSPIQEVLINLRIPVLSTSALGRIIVLFSFSFAILSAFGFDALIEDIKTRRLRPIILWLSAILAVFGVTWLMIYLKLYFPTEKIGIASSNMILPSLIIIVFFVLLSGTLFIKRKNIIPVLVFGLIIIISFDMLRFSSKWMPSQDKNLAFPEIKFFQDFNRVAPQDRIIASFGNEGSGILKLSSTEGYDPLYIKSYGEFIMGEGGEYKIPERSVVRFPRISNNNEKLLNFLGVRYVIHKKSDGYNSWAYPFWEMPDQFKLIQEDDKYQIFDNTNVLPRAIILGKYKVIDGKKETLKAIYDDRTDLKTEVILNKKPKLEIKESKNSQANLISYSENKIKIETSSPNDSILLLADPYYPGWKAFIDNKESEILKADYAFRAVEVPKGTHIVNFIYSPGSIKLGFIFSFFGFAGILGMRIKKKKL